MSKVMNFSENLEKGFAKIGHRIHEDLRDPEVRALPEREMVKKTILSIAREIPEEPAPSPQKSGGEDSNLPSYFIDEDSAGDEARKAVEHLIDIALHGDIEKAIKTSRQYPAFVEDAFHDALVDKLIPELKRKGILKQS